PAPRHDQLACSLGPFRMNERRVALKERGDLEGVPAGLQDGVRLDYSPALGVKDGALPREFGDGFQLPVLHLEDQESQVRMEHDEVGVPLAGTDWHVVPTQVVRIELVLEPLGEPALSRGHPWQARIPARYELPHLTPSLSSSPHRKIPKKWVM